MASEKINALVEEVKGLTVLELSELVHTLEEVFGVSAAAAAVAGPAVAAAAEVEEKTEFDVILKEATSVVFVDYKGINVAQDTALRKQFRDAGVEYTVVKNTLTRFAAKENGYDFDEVLNGTTAMASTTGDPIAPARIVCEFAKKNKNTLSIKGGVVEGSVLSADQLNGFGELPSKNALVAQVLGTFLAPISSLAFVLDQIRQQKEGGAPAAEAAEA